MYKKFRAAALFLPLLILPEGLVAEKLASSPLPEIIEHEVSRTEVVVDPKSGYEHKRISRGTRQAPPPIDVPIFHFKNQNRPAVRRKPATPKSNLAPLSSAEPLPMREILDRVAVEPAD